jgi:hypothetical protein
LLLRQRAKLEAIHLLILKQKCFLQISTTLSHSAQLLWQVFRCFALQNGMQRQSDMLQSCCKFSENIFVWHDLTSSEAQWFGLNQGMFHPEKLEFTNRK